MFDKEELKEIKLALNSMVASRITYKIHESNKVRLNENDKYLEMDYKLIEKIIYLMEEGNERAN